MLVKAFGSSPSGKYSAGGIRCHAATKVAHTVTAIVVKRLTGPLVNQLTPCSIIPRRCRSSCVPVLFPRPKRAQAAGTTPTANNIEARIATEIAIAISEYNCPASSCTNNTGANTRIVVILEASTAVQTSRTPTIAASIRSSPRRLACSMLSSTTMVLSTVIPMAKAIPAREITLIVRSNTKSPKKAAMIQTGIPINPINVPRRLRRNKKRIKVASKAPNSRFCETF